MNGKPISNSEDQEAARPHRIVIKFRSGFHLLHIQIALVYSLYKFLTRFLSLFTNPYKDYLFTDTVKNHDGSVGNNFSAPTPVKKATLAPIWELLRGFKRTWNTPF